MTEKELRKIIREEVANAIKDYIREKEEEKFELKTGIHKAKAIEARRKQAEIAKARALKNTRGYEGEQFVDDNMDNITLNEKDRSIIGK